MRYETRTFNIGTAEEKRQLLLISESEAESKALDRVFSNQVPTKIKGTRQLSDGYAEDCIRLELDV